MTYGHCSHAPSIESCTAPLRRGTETTVSCCGLRPDRRHSAALWAMHDLRTHPVWHTAVGGLWPCVRTRALGWQDGKKFGHAAKTLTLMNSGKLDGSQYRGRVLLSLEIVPAPHGHPFKPSKAGQEMILRPCLSAPLCDTQRAPHARTSFFGSGFRLWVVTFRPCSCMCARVWFCQRRR